MTTVWKGKFLLTEGKGLTEKRGLKKPKTSGVRKTIEKDVSVEKLKPSDTEKLLKRTLIEKQYKLLFADEDGNVGLMNYIQRALMDSKTSELEFEEAAIRAKIHLDATYGRLQSSPESSFSVYDALSPFHSDLTADSKVLRNAAKIYMWFLYGADKNIANTVFESILKRDRVNVDLYDFIGVGGRMFDAKLVGETVSRFENWAEDVYYHSFDALRQVLSSVGSEGLKKLVNVALELNIEQLSSDQRAKSYLIYMYANKARIYTADELIFLGEQQKMLSELTFPTIDVDKTRILYSVYDVPKYWLSFVKSLVAREKISVDNLVFLVSELQKRRALEESEEAELLDAVSVLQLTRDLASAEITERRRGFTFSGV